MKFVYAHLTRTAVLLFRSAAMTLAVLVFVRFFGELGRRMRGEKPEKLDDEL
jgi:hypothetical protein